MKTYTFSVDWFMDIEAESFQEARWEAERSVGMVNNGMSKMRKRIRIRRDKMALWYVLL